MTDKVQKQIENLMQGLNLPYYYIKVGKGDLDLLSFGYNEGEIATGNEKLFMYSCTKPLTVTCGLQLIERGLLSLDDKVGKYLPFVKDCYVVDNSLNKHIVGEQMTIKHLFTMTAGFTYNFEMEPFKQVFKDYDNPTTLQVVESICKSPLISCPGEQFNYSFCHDVLAAVIEVIAKKPFAEYMKDNIFKPLGLNNSAFDFEDKSDFANQYYYDNGFIKNKLQNSIVFSKNWHSGGAGVISTANDYYKFVKTLANGGGDLLSENSLAMLNKESVKHLNFHSNFTCVQGTDYGYGLGVRTRMKPTDYGLPIGEFGWDGAAGSYLMVDPINNISVFIAMHVELWPSFFLGKHLEIVKIIYENLIK